VQKGTRYPILHYGQAIPLVARLRAVDMVQIQATDDTLICAFRVSVLLPWQQIRGAHIVKAVKDAVKALGLMKQKKLYLKKVRLHSLRAGGAMGLYLNKHTTLEIQ